MPTATVEFQGRAVGRAASGTPRAGMAAWTSAPDTTFTPTLPPGWQPGDIHVLAFVAGATGARDNGVLDATVLTGWTQLYVGTPTAAFRAEIWWRRAQAGDVAPTLRLVTNAAVLTRGARIYGIPGVGPTGSPFAATSVLSVASDDQILFTDVTTTVAGQTALALGLAAYSTATDVSTMAGWYEPSDATATFNPNPQTDAANVLTDATNILTDGLEGPLLLTHQWRGVAAIGPAGATAMTVGSGTDLVTATGVVLAFALATNYASAGTAVVRGRGYQALVAARGATGVAQVATPARAASAGSRAVSEATTIFGVGRMLAVARPMPARMHGQTFLVASGVRDAHVTAGLRGTGLLAVPTWQAARAGASVGHITVSSAYTAIHTGGPFSVQISARPQLTLLLVTARGGATELQALVRAELAAIRKLRPQIPMQELTPVDLGTGYRGDTLILPIWVAQTREGEPYDLVDGILYFTAKENLTQIDVEPHVIQCSTEDGGITILDPPENGLYRVRIEADETQALPGDTVFTWDTQLQTDDAHIYTIKRGLLTVVRDVTRISV